MNRASPSYSWKKVLLILAFSSLIVSGVGEGSLFFYRRVVSKKGAPLEVLVQDGVGLPLPFFTEVLGLSVDRPTPLNQFSVDNALRCLASTHLFSEVELKKIKPNVLLIHYKLREPIAKLGDYSHTEIGNQGVIFSSGSLFPPKELPEVYLGELAPLHPVGSRLSAPHLRLVHDILAFLGSESVLRIDLSSAEAASAGDRQVVVSLKSGNVIRLTPKNYAQELRCYSILTEQIDRGPIVVDLRVPEVAYFYELS